MLPAELYLDRFLNRPNNYALQWSNQTRHGYRAVYEPFTLDILYQHLCGEITVGTYLISEKNTCKFMVWDIDEDQEDGVALLCSWLYNNGIYFFREAKREGRSGHVWVFVQTPIPSLDAFKLVGYGRSSFGLNGEIYPPHGKLKDTKSPGALVRLPLGVNRKPGVYETGLFLNCHDRDILNQLMWFIEQPINIAEEVLEVTKQIPDPIKKPMRKHKIFRESILERFPIDWPWTELNSGELCGPCPACRIAGHDSTGDNLFLNPESNVLYCFFDNGRHSFKEIMSAIQKAKKTVTILG